MYAKNRLKTGAMMNAITLLKNDHRKVERLFERYRTTTADGKAAILRELTYELSRHMAAEEKELYPVLRKTLPDGRSLMDDAVNEHQEAKGLLVELERSDRGSFDMDAKVATLRQAIEHHVKDEEEEIFPKMAEMLAVKRVEELGTRIARAKQAAPDRPSASAARRSPGTSLRGLASAATDRVTGLFETHERKSPRRSSSRTRPGARKAARTRKISTSSSKTKTKTKARVRSSGRSRKSKSVAKKASRR